MVLLDWPPPDHLGIGRKSRQFLPAQASYRDPDTGPRVAPPTLAAQTRIVSKARIRLDSRKSVRSFKGIICVDISEFESYMPSQAVRSPEANMRTLLKTARYRGNAIVGRLAASYRWRHSWQHAIESHAATNGGFIPGDRRSRVFSRSHSGTLDIHPAVRCGRERRRKIVVATRAAERPFQRAQAIGRRGAGPAFCGYPPRACLFSFSRLHCRLL